MENTARGQDVFASFAKMVRSLRARWLAEVQVAEWRPPQCLGQEGGFNWGRGLETPISMPFAMAGDDDDDAWLQAFLNV